MDLQLIAGLSLGAAVIAAAVSIACLVRIEDLHQQWGTVRPRGGRRPGALRGRGKIVPLRHDPPPRR
ncbi:MAG TPA: hypothetical protein VD969_18580 [Symbiobacteriaceae bacterium]|nr:hypothetical protein [Symbiobacteriaceae bacterium]